MKKIFLTGAAAILAAIAVTACGGGSSSTTTAAPTTAAAAETKAEETKAEETKAEETKAEETKAEETKAEEAAGGTFTVGFDQDFPPMGFVGDNGEFTGFDLDLAKEAASRMGMEVVYQPIAWDSKDAELDAGTIDCIWNGFTINGREDGYTWSEPYMTNDQVFVVTMDSGIASQADLAGKVVEVQVDSSAQAALNDLPELTATFASIQTTPDYNTAIMDLQSGAVDAIAMDSTVAGYKITTGGLDLVVLPDKFAEESYGIGFKKGNTELAEKVNAVLHEMAEDGTLEKISNEWFGMDVTIIGK
ncbi:MAG: amino acid ABC transporter substrate-binding protein [Stomatobaculum sp.]|nr:amino acid ABC transporter substrate-binding protein [Stomatobaculum sp.]